MSKYELIYGPKRAHQLCADDIYTRLGSYEGSDGKHYEVYHTFNQICPSCKNTLYESVHHQCCFKNCGVWNYLGICLAYFELCLCYGKPTDPFWVRKEDINHGKCINFDKKLEHHFCNKCNYDFYTIEGFLFR
jgi:hypothetical protein